MRLPASDGCADQRAAPPVYPPRFPRVSRGSAGVLALITQLYYENRQLSFAPVAQWIEQRFPKPLVGRSSRLGGAHLSLMHQTKRRP